MNENESNNATPTGVRISYEEYWEQLYSIHTCQSQNCNNINKIQLILSVFKYFFDKKLLKFKISALFLVNNPILPLPGGGETPSTELTTSEYKSSTSFFSSTTMAINSPAVSNTTTTFGTTTTTSTTMGLAGSNTTITSTTMNSTGSTTTK